jgi:hypothetical protein
MTARKKSSADGKIVNISRHKAQCTICANAKCAEVEAGFVNWESPAELAEEYDIADRTTVYRHAHALGLFDKRKRNVRAALERIIEKSGDGRRLTWANIGGKALVGHCCPQQIQALVPVILRLVIPIRERNEMSNPKPGDFPIGSVLSRAAARMFLKNQRDARKRIEFVTNALFPSPTFSDKQELDETKPHAFDWQDFGEVLWRFVYVTNGMSVDEAYRQIERDATWSVVN